MQILLKALRQNFCYKNISLALQSEDKKRLFLNFTFLFVLRLVNYIFPLVTLPYLVRVIGASYYGLFSLAVAYTTYFKVLTDYGFNLSATRDISIHRSDWQKVSEIFSSVIVIKLALTLFSFILMCTIVFAIQRFRQEYLIYILTFATVVGDVLFPVWFFQGIEKMEYITYINVVTKFILTVLTFTLINNRDDFLTFIVINAACSILTGLISLYLIKRKFRIKFQWPTLQRIKIDLFEGWYLFVSNCMSTIYINSNIFILGLFASNTVVGYYAIADKVISAVRSVGGIIFQCIYPQVCKKATGSFKQLRQFFRKIFNHMVIYFFCLGVIIFLFSRQIVILVAGTKIIEAAITLKILSFVPLIVALNMFPYQLLLIFNCRKSYLVVLGSGCILNLIFNFIFGSKFGILGTSVTVLITELYVTIFLYLILELKHKKYSLIKVL